MVLLYLPQNTTFKVFRADADHLINNDIFKFISNFTFSRAVAIPEMLQACENKNRIDKRISRFVIPFCVTLNADGSALFITAAAMFIANITGQSLTFGEVVIVG